MPGLSKTPDLINQGGGRFQHQRNRTPEINARIQTTGTPDIAADRVREILSAPRQITPISNENHRVSLNSEEGSNMIRPNLPRLSTLMTSSLLKKELLNMSTALARLKDERKEVNEAFDRY